jgi:glycine cleavage system H lipoate-binding protein
MVILIMLAMFLVFIGISYWREQAARHRATVAVKREKAQPVTVATYLHPSHSYARIVSDDLVEVGLDQFARHAFACLDEISLPEKGTVVHQGDIAWKARVGGRLISQRIPVDGVILETNEKRGSDWFLRIKPAHLSENLNNLIQSASSAQWLKLARAKFLMEHAGALVPAMQDGGELVEGFARHLTDAQWHEFCREFFNYESN